MGFIANKPHNDHYHCYYCCLLLLIVYYHDWECWILPYIDKKIGNKFSSNSEEVILYYWPQSKKLSYSFLLFRLFDHEHHNGVSTYTYGNDLANYSSFWQIIFLVINILYIWWLLFHPLMQRLGMLWTKNKSPKELQTSTIASSMVLQALQQLRSVFGCSGKSCICCHLFL